MDTPPLKVLVKPVLAGLKAFDDWRGELPPSRRVEFRRLVPLLYPKSAAVGDWFIVLATLERSCSALLNLLRY